MTQEINVSNINLRIKKSKGLPKIGMFVGLHGHYPLRDKYDLGVVIDIKDDELGLDFKYGVMDFGDNKIYYHHISGIIPLHTRFIF